MKLFIWPSDNLPWTHIWYRSRCDRHSGHLRLESLKRSNFCAWVEEPLPCPADILIPVLVLFPAHPSYSIVPVLNVKWTVPSMRRKSQGQKTVTVWEEICESLCLSADNAWYCVYQQTIPGTVFTSRQCLVMCGAVCYQTMPGTACEIVSVHQPAHQENMSYQCLVA